jgi:hypothetical protein
MEVREKSLGGEEKQQTSSLASGELRRGEREREGRKKECRRAGIEGLRPPCALYMCVCVCVCVCAGECWSVVEVEVEVVEAIVLVVVVTGDGLRRGGENGEKGCRKAREANQAAGSGRAAASWAGCRLSLPVDGCDYSASATVLGLCCSLVGWRARRCAPSQTGMVCWKVEGRTWNLSPSVRYSWLSPGLPSPIVPKQQSNQATRWTRPTRVD